MVYTLIGNKDLVSEEIKKITKNISKENIVIYDLSLPEVNLDMAINDINTFSLFGVKVVEVLNIDLVSDVSVITDYLNNPSDNILIFCSQKELDKRKKITKILEEKTKFKSFLKYDLTSLVKEHLEGYKMNFMDINLLVTYCNNDVNMTLNNLEKLKLYKIDSKEINGSDIKRLVRKSYDSTIFDLIDSINIKDKDRIFEIYNELIEEGDTDERIMYTIANHYRLLFQISIKLLYLSDDEIIKEYKMHPYRLTKLKEQLRVIEKDDILKILKSLGDIDIGVKSGKKNINTELFIFFRNL